MIVFLIKFPINFVSQLNTTALIFIMEGERENTGKEKSHSQYAATAGLSFTARHIFVCKKGADAGRAEAAA